jgi:MYXO-CTERM domain-containing protein
MLLVPLAAQAAPFTWTGAAGTGRWGDAGNWAGGVAPGDDGGADVTFGAADVVTLDGTRVISSLSVAAAGDVTLQAGAKAESALVLRGAGLSRASRGQLVVQVPVLGTGPVALSGFEPQTALSAATVFDLTLGAWPGLTSLSQAVLTASGDAIPPSSRLDLGPESALNVNGQTVGLGSLTGSGSVINASRTKGTLVIGFDGTDSTYAGDIGAVLADQPDNGYIDLVKVGAGTLTATGSLRLGGLFGRVRVLEGTLIVTGTLSGLFPILNVESSTSWHGTLGGTGNVGWLRTSDNSVPGATVSPGLPGSKGILHAQSCDLRKGTLAIRVSAYATAGSDFDQLDCGNGSLQFDADSDVTVDLGGSSSAGGPVPIATYGSGNGPTAPQPSQIHLINNPAGLSATLNPGQQSMTLTLKASGASPAPLFVITPGHGLVTSERGRSAAFTVALGRAPSKNVTVPVASNNTAEGTVSPTSLNFTSLNWSTPQTVTATGVDDAAPDGNVAYAIVLGPCASTDPAYKNQSPPQITAVNLDDDLIAASPLTGLVSQPGGAAALTLTFLAPVSGTQDVWLQLRSSDPALAWPSPALVHVTASNGTPAAQVVNLAGAHRLEAGCSPYTVSGTVISTDSRYDGFELPAISACNQGDHAPAASPLTLSIDPFAILTRAAPGVLAQAMDPDGDPLAALLVQPPAHGSVSLAADGSFSYTPNPGYSGADAFIFAASDGVLSSPPASVAIQIGAPPDVAGLTLVMDGGSMPGSDVALHAAVTNLGAAALRGVWLQLAPEGLELGGASGPSGALVTTSGTDVLLADLAPGETARIDVPARISGSSGARAGAAAVLWSPSAGRLAAPRQAFIEVSRLRFDAGGCGCRTGNPGGAMLWLGALALLAPRRRRSPLPGRAHPDARGGLVARHLRAVHLLAPEGIDGDHRDPLPALVEADLRAELAGRSHLHRLPLHVDAASGGDLAAHGHRAAVGLVTGPADRQQDLLQRFCGLVDRARLHARHLILVQLDGLAGGGQRHRAPGGRDHHVLALGGEEEVPAGAVRDGVAAFHLERHAPAPLLDVRFDPPPHARAQGAGGDRGQPQLAAIVQPDADAVDGQLRLAVARRAQPVAGADAVAPGRRAPGAAAALQLDGALAVQEQRGLREAGIRRARLGAWDRCRGRGPPSTPARLHTHQPDRADCCGKGAHAPSYTGARGSIAMKEECEA